MLQDTWYREAVNKNQYSNEILRSVDQALYPDEDTRKLVREIDKAYNTNYEKAYSDIAYKEITGRKDIDRLNRLVPMEWLLPTIGLGGAEFFKRKTK